MIREKIFYLVGIQFSLFSFLCLKLFVIQTITDACLGYKYNTQFIILYILIQPICWHKTETNCPVNFIHDIHYLTTDIPLSLSNNLQPAFSFITVATQLSKCSDTLSWYDGISLGHIMSTFYVFQKRWQNPLKQFYIFQPANHQ